MPHLPSASLLPVPLPPTSQFLSRSRPCARDQRELFGESDELLATKLAYVLSKGFKCVFAIGEKLKERQEGKTMAVCVKQLEKVTHLLHPDKVVIAYEPVWAIGTGVTATPAQAQETHRQIRAYLATAVGEEYASYIRIQYGGSANAKNAPDLSAKADIDGFLVGGASLKPEFAHIVRAIRARIRVRVRARVRVRVRVKVKVRVRVRAAPC